MAEMYSELDQNYYDYMHIMDIRNMFEKLRIEIFDQSYLRRGNRQNLNFQNCEGKTIEFELSDVSRNLRFPDEFLKKISSTPGLINYSELMKLPEREFQSRIFAEIDRILNKVSLHLPAGRYYLHVAGILRKTFFMIAETQFKISIE